MVSVRKLAACLLLSFVVGCGPAVKHEEPAYEADLGHVCRLQGETYVGCGGDVSEDLQACRDSCAEREYWMRRAV